MGDEARFAEIACRNRTLNPSMRNRTWKQAAPGARGGCVGTRGGGRGTKKDVQNTKAKTRRGRKLKTAKRQEDKENSDRSRRHGKKTRFSFGHLRLAGNSFRRSALPHGLERPPAHFLAWCLFPTSSSPFLVLAFLLESATECCGCSCTAVHFAYGHAPPAPSTP
jgi:hypothetical protein